MELKVVQKQAQVLSPMMIQSMEILQMGAQELAEFVEKTLQENPVLEAEDHKEHNREEFADLRRKLEWLQSSDRQNHAYYQQDDEDAPLADLGVVEDEERSLYGHLLFQLRGLKLESGVREGAVFLAESLDRSGWLDEDLPALAEAARLPLPVMEQALEVLQSLDPAGVGARGLNECLCIQLRRKYPRDNLALRVVQECLEPLARNQYGLIARTLRADAAAVRAACDRIRGLDPRPGAGFAGREETSYVTPDLIVSWQYDHFEVQPCRTGIPTLSLSGYYTRMLKESGEQEVQDYLSDKVRQAKWVMHSIEQRQSTLLACARCILELQEEFFRRGPGHLVPMTLADVAGRVGVHESTVSRALKDKYLQCDRGTYPLTYFFSRKLGESGSGDATPDRAKALLRRLIDGEDKARPLSDQKLCERMEREGCPISRRTVAKYREELGIPSTAGRKRYEQMP